MYHPHVQVPPLRRLARRPLTSPNDMSAPLLCSPPGAKITLRNVNRLPSKHTAFCGPSPASVSKTHPPNWDSSILDSEAKVDGEDTFNVTLGILSQQFFLFRTNTVIIILTNFPTAEKEIYFFSFFTPHISFPLFFVADRWAFTPIH